MRMPGGEKAGRVRKFVKYGFIATLILANLNIYI